MLTWRRIRRALDGFPITMFRFTVETFGSTAVEEAWEEFVMDTDLEHSEFDPTTPHIQLFMPWFFHCWSPDGEEVEGPAMTTPTRAFLEARGSRLDPLVKRYLEACLEAPFSFHEIVRSDPGRGFGARDVITGAEHQVFEQSASKSMQVGDILYGQLVKVDGIAMVEACAPCPIPPIRKIELIDLRQSLSLDSELVDIALLKDIEWELREFYFIMADDVLNPKMPQMHNTDGDPLELQRLIFDVDSPQAAFDALAHLAFETTPQDLLEDATRDADGALRAVEFDWAKAGNSKHAEWTNTILGHIKIDGTRLTLRVNSAKRAQEGRRLVEGALGSHVRHRATEIDSTEKMLEEARAERLAGGKLERDPEHEALMAHPQVREQLQNMMSAHFEKWVDSELPALGGLTPVEAIRTPAGKEKVAALLLDAERHARKMESPVEETLFARVRERLGLSAPAG